MFPHSSIYHLLDTLNFTVTFGERIISQLRTGYVGLNEYLHKCNVKENDNCECGGIETVGHYLLECPKYEKEREILRKRIFDSCGIANFGLNMLLDVKKEEDFKECRNTILSHLENYVVETRRFATQMSN